MPARPSELMDFFREAARQRAELIFISDDDLETVFQMDEFIDVSHHGISSEGTIGRIFGINVEIGDNTAMILKDYSYKKPKIDLNRQLGDC